MIIQSGITEVIYLGDKYHDSNMSVASRRMFDMAGVKYTKYSGKMDDIVIKMNDLSDICYTQFVKRRRSIYPFSADSEFAAGIP